MEIILQWFSLVHEIVSDRPSLNWLILIVNAFILKLLLYFTQMNVLNVLNGILPLSSKLCHLVISEGLIKNRELRPKEICKITELNVPYKYSAPKLACENSRSDLVIKFPSSSLLWHNSGTQPSKIKNNKSSRSWEGLVMRWDLLWPNSFIQSLEILLIVHYQREAFWKISI